jgi:hypothetical protein
MHIMGNIYVHMYIVESRVHEKSYSHTPFLFFFNPYH